MHGLGEELAGSCLQASVCTVSKMITVATYSAISIVQHEHSALTCER